MKKILLAVSVFVSAFSFSFAQSIGITPNDTFSHTGPLVNFMDQVELDGFVVNNTNSADSIFWYVDNINHPVDWEMSVCDKVSCFIIYNPGEVHYFDIAAHAQEILHFLCTPNCAAGDGNIEITMWMKSDSAGTVVHPRFFATYTGVCGTGINETANEAVKIFPTNFQEQVTVEGMGTSAVKSAKLFNAAGEMMLASSSVKGSTLTLETAKLVAGVYILRLETSNGIVSKKLVKE